MTGAVKRPGIFAILVAAALAVGAALRLHQLGRHSLWFDEALEYGRAAGSLSQALIGRAIDQDPPAMALLNFLWVRLGDGEAWMRLPSVVFGLAAILVVAMWARRELGDRIALLAAALMALSPVLVHYSQELNQYAALVFLAAATMAAFERLLRRGHAADWMLYGAVTVLGLATHFGLAFLLAVLWLYLATRVWRSGPARDRTRLAAYTACVALVVAALWWLGLGSGLAVPHLDRRLGGTHLEKELDYITDVGWREILVFYLMPFSGGPALTAVRGLALVAAAGAVSLWRRGGAGRRVVGLYFFGPLALTYLASLMGWYPLGYRYGLFAVPALFIGIAAGIDALWRRNRAAGMVLAGAACVALLLGSTHLDDRNPWLMVPREDMRPVASHVAEYARVGDLVYVYYGALPAYGYYGRAVPGTVIEGRHLDATTAASEADRVRELAAGEARAWIVMSHVRGAEGEALLAAMLESGASGDPPRLVDSFAATNASAYLLQWP